MSNDQTTARERNQPTPDEQIETLELLVGAAEAGQLVGLVFMLQAPDGRTVVDYRGSHELVELAARTVRQRIADEVGVEYPEIAEKILASNIALELRKPH